jgi:hypothetical protein
METTKDKAFFPITPRPFFMNHIKAAGIIIQAQVLYPGYLIGKAGHTGILKESWPGID